MVAGRVGDFSAARKRLDPAVDAQERSAAVGEDAADTHFVAELGERFLGEDDFFVLVGDEVGEYANLRRGGGWGSHCGYRVYICRVCSCVRKTRDVYQFFGPGRRAAWMNRLLCVLEVLIKSYVRETWYYSRVRMEDPSALARVGGQMDAWGEGKKLHLAEPCSRG